MCVLSCPKSQELTVDYLQEGKNLMDQCTLNCVLRRVFCLLEDLVISSGVKVTKHHVVRETSESPTIVELTSIA